MGTRDRELRRFLRSPSGLPARRAGSGDEVRARGASVLKERPARWLDSMNRRDHLGRGVDGLKEASRSSIDCDIDESRTQGRRKLVLRQQSGGVENVTHGDLDEFVSIGKECRPLA